MEKEVFRSLSQVEDQYFRVKLHQYNKKRLVLKILLKGEFQHLGLIFTFGCLNDSNLVRMVAMAAV